MQILQVVALRSVRLLPLVALSVPSRAHQAACHLQQVSPLSRSLQVRTCQLARQCPISGNGFLSLVNFLSQSLLHLTAMHCLWQIPQQAADNQCISERGVILSCSHCSILWGSRAIVRLQCRSQHPCQRPSGSRKPSGSLWRLQLRGLRSSSAACCNSHCKQRASLQPQLWSCSQHDIWSDPRYAFLHSASLS